MHFFSYGLKAKPELHVMQTDFSKSKYGLLDGQSMQTFVTLLKYGWDNGQSFNSYFIILD